MPILDDAGAADMPTSEYGFYPLWLIQMAIHAGAVLSPIRHPLLVVFAMSAVRHCLVLHIAGRVPGCSGRW